MLDNKDTYANGYISIMNGPGGLYHHHRRTGYDLKDPYYRIMEEIDNKFYPDRFEKSDCGCRNVLTKTTMGSALGEMIQKEIIDAYTAGLMEGRLGTLRGIIGGIIRRSNKRGWRKVSEQILKLVGDMNNEGQPIVARDSDLFNEGTD